MTWLYYSLGAALCYASLNILSRTVSVDSKNPRALSLAFNLASIFMAVILFLLTRAYKRIIFPSQTEAWVYLLIAGIFLLKEKSNLFRKIFAGIITVIGVFLLR